MTTPLRTVFVWVLGLLLLTACGAAPAAPPVPPPTTAPVSATPAPGSTDLATGTPLWPFLSVAEVAAWQEQYRAGGAQPWHLDAESTALAFTQGFLGFSGIDQVTSREGSGLETWVGVGYRTPEGSTTSTAAVLHLAKFGTAQDAPWVVVGSRDTSLTVGSPAYGSAATWPLPVGGVITGVDESLHVRVLAATGDLVGESCCAPAGGEKTPWTVPVDKKVDGTGNLTVVVSTGGHVVDVERFAITAVLA